MSTPRSFWPPPPNAFAEDLSERALRLQVYVVVAAAIAGCVQVASGGSTPAWLDLWVLFFAFLAAGVLVTLGAWLSMWSEGRGAARAVGACDEPPLAFAPLRKAGSRRGARLLAITADEVHVRTRKEEHVLCSRAELVHVEVVDTKRRSGWLARAWAHLWAPVELRLVLDPEDTLAAPSLFGKQEKWGDLEAVTKASLLRAEVEAYDAALKAAEKAEEAARSAAAPTGSPTDRLVLAATQEAALEGTHEAAAAIEPDAAASQGHTPPGPPAPPPGSEVTFRPELSPPHVRRAARLASLPRERLVLPAWACEPLLRWLQERGHTIVDDANRYPDVEAARAAAGVERFWPPPRGAAIRYFVGFAGLIMAICALPALIMLAANFWKNSPGVSDMHGHLDVMLRPVASTVGGIVGVAVLLTLAQIVFLRLKLFRAAKRVRLLPGEALLALCYARCRDGREPKTAPTWGEFFAVTDRRLLAVVIGDRLSDTRELVRRDRVAGWARANRGENRHPLLNLVLEAWGDASELRIYQRNGKEIRVRTEVLFFEPLLSWLAQHGAEIEEWGWLPDPDLFEPDPERPPAPHRPAYAKQGPPAALETKGLDPAPPRSYAPPGSQNPASA